MKAKAMQRLQLCLGDGAFRKAEEAVSPPLPPKKSEQKNQSVISESPRYPKAQSRPN